MYLRVAQVSDREFTYISPTKAPIKGYLQYNDFQHSEEKEN